VCEAAKAWERPVDTQFRGAPKVSYVDAAVPIRMWLGFPCVGRSPCFGQADIRASFLRRYCLGIRMQKDILINAGAGEIRVAVVEDGRLQDLMLERTTGLEEGGSRKKPNGRAGHSIIGNIILGPVQR